MEDLIYENIFTQLKKYSILKSAVVLVAFKSCHPIACCIKKKRSTNVLLIIVMGDILSSCTTAYLAY